VLVRVGIGVVVYFLLSLIALGAYTAWCDYRERQNQQAAERFDFERHAAKELSDHLRVVGGNHIPSEERWSA